MDSTYWYTNDNTLAILIIDYNCSVKGVTIINHGTGACIYVRQYASANISDCSFKGFYGISLGGGSYEVTNCIFDSCSRAIDGVTGHYIIKNNLLRDGYGSTGDCMNIIENSALIENNIMINDELTFYVNGLIIYNYPNVIIRNNVLFSTYEAIRADPYLKLNNSIVNARRVGFSAIEVGDSVINNTVSNTVNAAYCDGSGQAYVAYNNFWQISSDLYVGVIPETVNNIYRNPMFVSNNDFHLQMYSPLIDAGDPNRFDTDSTRSDIGAYGGPYGSSYPYQDLPPRTPDTIRGNYNQDTAFISWTTNNEADFNRYLLYRDTVGGFIPSTANLIAQPETSVYVDLDVSNLHYYYYRVAAVDNQDNVSGYSAELVVITTDIWNQPGAELPQVTAISSNYPNPFNVSTVVVYRVANLGPMPAQININIYDITGRKGRELVNQRKEVGVHRVTWDGKNESGERCPSGVYFAKISQWDISLAGKPRKLVLLK